MDNNPIINSIIVQTRTTGVDEAIREIAKLEKKTLSLQRHLTGQGQPRLYNAAADIKQLQLLDFQFAKAFRPGVKSAGAFVTNLSNVAKALKTNRVAGVATAKSLANLNRETKEYDANALGMLNRQQKQKVMMTAIGTGLKDLSAKYQRLGRDMQWMGRNMTVGVTLPMAAGATIAIKAWNRLDEQVTRVQKVTTSKQFDKLGGADGVIKSAKELGAEFGIVSEMVAAVQGDFAAMGYTAKKDLRGITKLSLEIARLGEVNLSDSTKAVRSVVEIFGGLEDPVSEASKVLYAFNAIENNTAIGLKDLIPTFPQVANAAKNFGMTAEETAAAMAGMYEQGIPASEVATSLKYVLASLVKPTQQTKDMIAELALKEPELASVFKGLETGAIQGRAGLEQLSGAYAELTKRIGIAEATELLVNIVGKRQVNRVLALFNSIEVARGEAFRVTGKEDLAGLRGIDPDKLQSDYARALAVGGQSDSERLANAKKAQRELNAIYKSDAFQREQAMAKLKTAVADIGRVISGPVSDAIGQLASVLKTVTTFFDNNPWAQKFAMGAAVAVAAIGPLVFIFGQAIQIFGTLGKVVTKVIKPFAYFSREALMAASAADLASGNVLQLGDYVARSEGPASRLGRRMRELRGLFGGAGQAATEMGDTVQDVVDAEELRRQQAAAAYKAAEKQKQATSSQTAAVEKATSTASQQASEAVASAKAVEAKAQKGVATATQTATTAASQQAAITKVWVGASEEARLQIRQKTGEYIEETVAIKANTAALVENAAAAAASAIPGPIGSPVYGPPEPQFGRSGYTQSQILDALMTKKQLPMASLQEDLLKFGKKAPLSGEALLDQLAPIKTFREYSPNILAKSPAARILSTTSAEISDFTDELFRTAQVSQREFIQTLERGFLEYGAMGSKGAFRLKDSMNVAFRALSEMPNTELIRQAQAQLTHLQAVLKNNEILEKLMFEAGTTGFASGVLKPGPAGSFVRPTGAGAGPAATSRPVARGRYTAPSLTRTKLDEETAARLKELQSSRIQIAETFSKNTKEISKQYGPSIRGFDKRLRRQITESLQQRLTVMQSQLDEAYSVISGDIGDRPSAITQATAIQYQNLAKKLETEISRVSRQIANVANVPTAQLENYLRKVQATAIPGTVTTASLVDNLVIAEKQLSDIQSGPLPSLTKEQMAVTKSIAARKATIAKLREEKAIFEQNATAAVEQQKLIETIKKQKISAARAASQLQELDQSVAKAEASVQEAELARSKAQSATEKAAGTRRISSAQAKLDELRKEQQRAKSVAKRSSTVLENSEKELIRQREIIKTTSGIQKKNFDALIKTQETEIAKLQRQLPRRTPVGTVSAERKVISARKAARDAVAEGIKKDIVSQAQAEVDAIKKQMRAPGMAGPIELDDIRRVGPTGQLLSATASKRQQLQTALAAAEAKLVAAQSTSLKSLYDQADLDIEKMKQSKLAIKATEDLTDEEIALRKQLRDESKTRRRQSGTPVQVARGQAAEARLAKIQAERSLKSTQATTVGEVYSQTQIDKRREEVRKVEEATLARRARLQRAISDAARQLDDEELEALRKQQQLQAERARRAAAKALYDPNVELQRARTRANIRMFRARQMGDAVMAFEEAEIAKEQAAAQLRQRQAKILDSLYRMPGVMLPAAAEEKAFQQSLEQAQPLGPRQVMTPTGPALELKRIPGQELAYRKELAARQAVAMTATQAEVQNIARKQAEINQQRYMQAYQDAFASVPMAERIKKREAAEKVRRIAQKRAARSAAVGTFTGAALATDEAGRPMRRGLMQRLYGGMNPTVQSKNFMGKLLAPVQAGIAKLGAIIPAGGILGSLLGGTGAGTVTGALFTGLMSALSSIPMAVIAIGAAIVGLIALAAKLSGHWKSFWEGVKAGVKPAVGLLKGAWGTIKDAFMSVWETLKDIWQPFQKIINDIIGLMSGEKGGGTKKAASGWRKIGVVIGGIGTVLAFVVRVIAELVAQTMKAVALVVKFLAYVLRISPPFKLMVAYTKLIAGFIGHIVKNWREFANSIIDVINDFIKIANVIPGVNIKLIPQLVDKEELDKDFKSLVERVSTDGPFGQATQSRIVLINTKFKETLDLLKKMSPELKNWEDWSAARKQDFKQELRMKITLQVDEAEAKLSRLESKKTTLQNQEALGQNKINDLMEQRASIMEKMSDTTYAPNEYALKNQLANVDLAIEKQKDNLNDVKNKIQNINEEIKRTQGFLPQSLDVLTKENLNQAAFLQKQIDEQGIKAKSLAKEIAKTPYGDARDAMIKELEQARALRKEAIKEREKLLRAMYKALPDSIKQRFKDFGDFKAYVDVEFRYDENTAKTFEDRIDKIMATMPEQFEKFTDEATEAAIEAAQKYWDTLKGKLDEITGKLREQALQSFDEGAKQRLAVFDEQIKAIEDLEKAEQELFETQQYYENRRKALNDFAVTSENYRRDRAVAIYEGRYDDARMLDLQYQADARNHQERLGDLDNERNKALIQKERDAQKERLNAQKEALSKQLELQRQHFEEMLAVITEYTPKNAAELQNMIDTMNGYLTSQGMPMIAQTWADGTALWSEAARKAGTDLAEAAFWAGQGAAIAAMAGMSGQRQSTEFKEWLAKLSEADRDAVMRRLSGQADDQGRANQLNDAQAMLNAWALGFNGVGPFFFHQGGMVGAKNATAADVPAVLQTGEFVMQRKAVDKLGVGFLSSLNKYHEGGLVGKGVRSMLFGNLGLLYNSMLQGGMGMAGLGLSAIKILRGAPENLRDLVGTGAIPEPEARPMTTPVDPNALLVQPFQKFLSIIFPDAARAIMSGSTYRESSMASFHSTGQALDIGDALAGQANLEKIFRFLIPRIDKLDIVELIFRDLQYDKGPGWRYYSPMDHYDHIHVAFGSKLTDLVERQGRSFFYPLMRGGKIPVDNLPALLHKGEVVLPANIVRNIEAANQNAGGDTYICVDTFIGQRQWFESMMKEYNVKTLPAEQRRRGTMNRVVSSRKDNTVRYV